MLLSRKCMKHKFFKRKLSQSYCMALFSCTGNYYVVLHWNWNEFETDKPDKTVKY